MLMTDSISKQYTYLATILYGVRSKCNSSKARLGIDLGYKRASTNIDYGKLWKEINAQHTLVWFKTIVTCRFEMIYENLKMP